MLRTSVSNKVKIEMLRKILMEKTQYRNIARQKMAYARTHA